MFHAGRSGDAYTQVPTLSSVTAAARASAGAGAGCQCGTSGMSSVEYPLSAIRRTVSRHAGRVVVIGATAPKRNGLVRPVVVESVILALLPRPAQPLTSRLARADRPAVTLWPMSDAFADLTGSLDPALVVVTTALDGERAGCLVGFHAQSSIEPARYCVWLSKANHTCRVAQRSSHFAVHLLTESDTEIAELFGTRSGDDGDKFAGLPVSEAAGGVPILDDCPNRIVLRRIALLDEGSDHLCVSGEVVEVHGSRGFRPFRLSQAAGFEAGHASEERPEPPTERAVTG
jgi:flavin reductase (DIM6/NTAB) family NADH-FMN oxidoreductase RutF